MKKLHGFACVGALLLGAATLTGCGENYDLTLKVWVATNIKALTQQQIKEWTAQMKAESGINIGVKVTGVGEGDAASNMITDVEAGADIFGFAQDQLARLKSAGALAEVTDPSLKNRIKEANDEGSYAAASVGDALVAYPMTSDNGYFMYYDKDLFKGKEADLADLDKILDVLHESGRKFYMNAAGSAWYNYAFFYGFGAHSRWKTNSQGLFYEYDDTFNSKEGQNACIALYNLVNTHKDDFVDNSTAGDAFKKDSTGKISAGVLISGTWDYSTAKIAFGDNLGAAELPSVTITDVDGNEMTRHLGSFKGFKLMGVKPQKDTKRLAYAQLLAEYLTAKDCQLQRFNEFGWGPSNVEAQATDAVKSNIALQALAAQNEYAEVQGQYPGDWWASAAAISQSLTAETCKGTVAEIKAILKKYYSTVDTYINGEPDTDL